MSGGSLLSAFDGENPTGTWSLLIDDLGGDSGTMAGWTLTLDNPVDAGWQVFSFSGNTSDVSGPVHVLLGRPDGPARHGRGPRR